MSTISDALKKAQEVYWIVKAEIGGRSYWWGTKTLSIPNPGGDNILVDGLLLDNISFGQSLDIRNLQASVTNVSVRLANRDRVQDLEAVTEIDGSFASIYVWCDGLNWVDIEMQGLVFRGLIQKNSHDRTTYAFSIIDQSKQLMRTIPPAAITATTWPNHRTIGAGGTVAGFPQPIIFGDWAKGIPILAVDTVAFKYLAAANDVLSTDAEYTATTENIYDLTGAAVDQAFNPFTLTLGYDGSGNVVSFFDFDADPINIEPMTCSIRGMKDDGAGTYTGTALSLIELPGSIIHYLLANHTDIDRAYIDAGSCKTMNSILPAAKMAVYLNAQASTLDVINRICRQVGAFFGPRPCGKVGVTTLNFDALTVGWVDCQNDGVGDPTFTKTELENVVNALAVQYGFNPSSRAFEGSASYDRANNEACERSYVDYGTAPAATLDLYDVQTQATERILAGRYLSLYSTRRNVIEFPCPAWAAWDYQLGDVAEITAPDGPSLDGFGWVNRRCLLLEKNYQGATANTKWMEVGAGTVPAALDTTSAKDRLVADIQTLVGAANIKGLWIFDATGTTQTVADLSGNAHTITLRDGSLNAINASTCMPGVQGLAPYLTMDAAHLFDTPDHADFSPTSGGGTDTPFSVVALANMIAMNSVVLFAKQNNAVGNNLEYNFYFDAAGSLLNVAFYHADGSAVIGRSCSTPLTAQVGAWSTFGFTYSGSEASTGLKLWNDGSRVDDTDANGGAYTGLTNGAALPGGYFNAGLWPTNGKMSILLVASVALTAAQIATLDTLLKEFANA